MVGAAAKREASRMLTEGFKVSKRRSCRVVKLSSATLFYRPKERGDGPIKKRMKVLAERFRRYGCPRIHYFLNKEKLVVNYKKTERLYRELGLQLGKRKRGKKMASVIRIPRPKATAPNEVWSIDFLFDALICGRRLKIMPVVDDFTKQCVTILVSRSITGKDIVDHFNTLSIKPKRIRCDNGPEFQSNALLHWADPAGIEIEFIDPGKPIQNAYIESFNGRLRDECLNDNVFLNVDDAKKKISDWIEEYHSIRPHSSLGMKTPNEFAEAWAR